MLALTYMNQTQWMWSRILNRKTLTLALFVFITSFLSGFLLNCATLSSKNDDQHTQSRIYNSTVDRYILPNGLKLLVVEDPSSPTFAYQTWFRVGSRHETVNYTGLAHLFEHMMFKRTTNYGEGESERLLERAGVEGFNAFTSKDFTAYVQELPSSRLELIIKIESDRMRNLVVDERAFITEREVVQNERRLKTESDPRGSLYHATYEEAFQKHPYRWPTIGYEADLMRMTAQDARDFYNRFYSPDRATIIVVGDVKKEKVLGLVKKYYGHYKPTGIQDIPDPDEPAQTKPKRRILKFNLDTEMFMIGYKVPGLQHVDMPSIVLAQNLLAEGNSSKLSQKLVDGGLLTNVGTYGTNSPKTSLAIFFGTLQKGKKATDAEYRIQNEINELIRGTININDIKKARSQLMLELLAGFGSSSSLARFLGDYETSAGSFELGIDLIQRTKEVTPQDIKRVLSKYFQESNRTSALGVSK